VVNRDFVQVSIVEDGSSRLGYVESSNKICCSSASILESIDISLAGRAGQEVMGLPPSGAESDLRNATRFAFSYIQNGFSPECGLLFLEEADEQMKSTARKLLEERYRRVCDLLRNSKPLLNRFAKMLVERRTLFHDDLRNLKKALAKKGAEYGNEV
jgi:ATP-dependent Zn protease